MRRRDFMKIIGGAAAWPPFAHAQPSTTPVIGFLHSASPQPFAPLVAAFREGLSEGPAGYVEGRDIKIEYRWAEGRGGSAGHVGGRSGGSTGGPDRCARRHALGIGSQSSNSDNSDSLYRWLRSHSGGLVSSLGRRVEMRPVSVIKLPK